MSWDGYFEVNGNEVINATRVEAYCDSAKLHWFRPVYKATDLPALLDDAAYTNPLADNAPWIHNTRLESREFYGVYPLSVTGVEDSTLTASVVESLGNGAVVSNPRSGSKTVVFNVLLIGGTPLAAEYGFQWLKTAVSDSCADDSTGVALCYYASRPELGQPADCRPHQTYSSNVDVVNAALFRQLRKVRVTNGPTVTSKADTHDGGSVWMVTFTVQAGAPFEYFAEEVDVLTRFLDGTSSNAAVWGGTVPAGGSLQTSATTITDIPCPVGVYAPVYDPLCPAVVPPPQAPGIVWGCYNPPTTWSRRAAAIPGNYFPSWGVVEPVIRLNAYNEAKRNVRIRFFLGEVPTALDPCAFCADFLITYIPLGETLVIDGSDRVVYTEGAGGIKRRADSLVFNSRGKSFDWPELTCGVPYVMTVDTPVGMTTPWIDLSLQGRSS